MPGRLDTSDMRYLGGLGSTNMRAPLFMRYGRYSRLLITGSSIREPRHLEPDDEVDRTAAAHLPLRDEVVELVRASDAKAVLGRRHFTLDRAKLMRDDPAHSIFFEPLAPGEVHGLNARPVHWNQRGLYVRRYRLNMVSIRRRGSARPPIGAPTPIACAS